MNDLLDLLIEKYINSELSDVETAELNEKLTSSREARDLFRGKIAIHGGLGELFRDEVEIPYLHESRPAKRQLLVQLGIAAVFVGMIVLLFRPASPTENSIAEIVGGSDPRWTSIVDHSLAVGRYDLLSGLAELQIGAGVTIAIEGPANFELVTPMHFKLNSGKLSANVRPESVGFVVETPEGKVVDLGTRFGVSVSKDSQTEAHVFEGEIDVVSESKSVRLSDSGAVRVSGLSPVMSDPSSFPMPRQILNPNWSGDIEISTVLGAGMPLEPGQWSGDLCEVVKREQTGIDPVSGDAMLRFLRTNSPKVPGSDGTVASELWQLVDLQGFTDQVNAGEVSVSVQASFNRELNSESHLSRLTVMGFRGQISDSSSYWKRKNEPTSEQLGSASANVLTDSDPETWEPLDVKMAVPPGTDFLIVCLTTARRSEAAITGYLADGVILELSTRARKSRPQAIWTGQGEFGDKGNWKDGKLPDQVHDTIDISGGEEAVINKSFSTKQSLIIAGGNGTVGKLRIAAEGELVKSGFGEVIIGFNPGAFAEMTVEGRVKTRGQVFVGRNNEKSTLIIDGGHWDAGDGLLRMSQYDSPVDTVSNLVIRNGGFLKAGALAMVNDRATLDLESGTVEVERLWVGGDNGEAQILLNGGVLKVSDLSFAEKTGKIVFRSPSSHLEIVGEWDLDRIFALSEAGWWVGQSTAGPDNLKVQLKDGKTLISMK